MRIRFIVTWGLLLAGGLVAQDPEPVQWTLTSSPEKAPPGSTIPLKLTASIKSGWHIYSMTTPKGGPLATAVTLAGSEAVDSADAYQPRPERRFDKAFGIDVEAFENEAVFWLPVTLKRDAAPGETELAARLRYQVCDDKQCLNKKKTLAVKVSVDPRAPAQPSFIVPAGYISGKPGAQPPAARVAGSANASEGLGGFILTAFGVGALAVFTPCVFPMIPITVSFFLNQRGGLMQAVVFSAGIVALFCALGLGVTAAVGPFGVVQLSANPWVNGFVAAIFAVFALSLLGAFEIALPSAMVTKLDRASRRGGYLGTLLMGLTFSLTSFACVGPFMGPLLVASAQGQGVRPVVGMAGFAAGLASPFFVLAAFPALLKKLPKSGGWLVRVKVVMGFVLLAVMCKYLSNVDQVLQTGFLTRERFLAAWFVLFAMAGLYLLGLLRLEGIDPGAPLGVGRLLTAGAFLILSFSLLPGMFGAPLGELDAYVPVAREASSGGNSGAGQVWMKDQYREALAKGRAENKLVLVTFTGYTCTNCHWMKANMFRKPEVAAALNDLVLLELYTDGTEKINEENQALEEQKFSTTSMPFFAIMNADEKVVATFPTATRDTEEFLAFLRSAKS
jgi:thiol:disulfide interchange protein DsbD